MRLAQAVAVVVATATMASATSYVGKPLGFGQHTTGGGDAPSQIPADIDELLAWLKDDAPRTILLDKEYNFIGSNGYCENCAVCSNYRCSPDSGQEGQWSIDVFKSGCKETATWPESVNIDVGSNRTILGVGDKGVLRGASLRFVYGAHNVIVQNVHITDLNPGFVWGGDAIYINGANDLWIDHVKMSHIGRQMISMGFESSGNVTISNCEFDGYTNTSATCNNKHYWTLLGMGEGDQVSVYGNWFHDTSGRSPDIGHSSTWHIFNNYWQNVDAALSIWPEPGILVEANYFDNTTDPTYGTGGLGMFIANDTTAARCVKALGRDCVPNYVDKSCKGTLTPMTADNTTIIPMIAAQSFPGIKILEQSQVKRSVLANAGVGKLGANDEQPSTPTRPHVSNSALHFPPYPTMNVSSGYLANSSGVSSTAKYGTVTGIAFPTAA